MFAELTFLALKPRRIMEIGFLHLTEFF